MRIFFLTLPNGYQRGFERSTLNLLPRVVSSKYPIPALIVSSFDILVVRTLILSPSSVGRLDVNVE